MRILVALMLLVSLGSAQDDLAKGKDALAKKSYDEALALFQKYIAANGRSAEGNFYVGETYRLKGDNQNALTALERAVDLDDEFEPGVAAIVRVYGKLGMWDKAAKRYKLIEKYHKNSIVGPLAYAQTYLEADSIDRATVFFSKVKELDPKNVDAYVGLAEVYGRQNVIVMAVDNLRTATQVSPNDPALWYKLALTIMKNRGLNAQQIQEVVQALQKSIELDPNNTQAVFDAANIFYKIKYWREAAEFYKKYTDAKKDNAEAWEKYGISAYNAKAFTDAVGVLDEAVKRNPQVMELRTMLGHSLYITKDFARSIAMYKSVPQDSLSADEIYRIGFSYYQTKDTVNAISYLERTLKLEKDNSDAIGTLAAIYLTQKKYEKAGGYYEQLLEKDPKNLTALFYAGFSYNVIGKQDTAKGFYKRLLALRPNNTQAHQSLIGIYSQQDSAVPGRHHANILIQLADSALKADPAKAGQSSALAISGYRSLALFDYRDKDVKGAIEKLEKALTYEKEKKDVGLHLFLAQMLAVQSSDKEQTAEEGRKVKARACQEYAIVLKLDPKNAAAKKESTQMQCGQ